jgi:hypothetical protein
MATTGSTKKGTFSRRVAPYVPLALAALAQSGIVGSGGGTAGGAVKAPTSPVAVHGPKPTGGPFVAGCAYPFADIAVEHSIDADCGAFGDATDGPNQAQNLAKNNFCAAGSAITVAANDLVQLQDAAVKAKIPSGSHDQLPPDRSVLKDLVKTTKGEALGEGVKVRLVAFVENAHYSDVPSAADRAKGKGGEAVNCNEFLNETNDIHIPLVETAGANECTSVTAEMSPHARPVGWTPAALNVAGQVVRVTGQLFFDGSHKLCLNGKGVPGNPARESLWEIHPVYALDVCSAKTIAECPVDDESKWHPLESK